MSKKIMFNDKFCLTQAVLSGTKTMTRRLLKVPKTCNGKEVYSFNILTNNACTQCVDLVDENGDVLGSWKPHYEVGDIVAIAQPYKDIIECMAEYSDIIINVDGSINREYKAGWTNKMFVRANLMPHHIRITDVKVERLKDISDDDILREGIRKEGYAGGCMYFYNKAYIRKGNRYVEPIYNTTPIRAFASLMYKVCGGETWESNPWVAAYSFELID